MSKKKDRYYFAHQTDRYPFSEVGAYMQTGKATEPEEEASTSAPQDLSGSVSASFGKEINETYVE